ncbi:DUF805 domain-containing protein [Brevundimonas sp.]|uniref:DUF805 domain-containing protein n=1 Tax=Brevundimonas sp. TaxID=1871086 RepID=UPI0028985AE9|nr:DUF805 domain-containing protein [Brevundimonas sp.]
MRGQITSYDTTTNTGTIRGEDGNSYVFARHDIHTGSDISVGHDVDFVPNGSTATQIVILGLASAAADAAASFGAAANSAINSLPGTDGYDFKSAMLSYTGRMRRQHFWISVLIIFGISLLTSWIPLLGGLIGLALIYPNVCITIKRLHDMGKTGWLTLVPYVGGLIAVIIMLIGGGGAFMMAAVTGGEPSAAAMMGAIGAISIGSLIAIITSLGFLLWIGITDSEPGTNQYGPNPKGL